jgi:hypothetical protein
MVELEELRVWQSEYYITYARTNEKELRCTLRGSYEVWFMKEKVLETMQPFVAVEKYNEL